MDTSDIIGIIGVIATIVFGFLSFDLFKRKKYPGKVTYVKLSLIDLLNNVANNFSEIKLLHDDSPIKKNIIYIKGALLNNGDIDINSQLTEKDISVHLPENCKWLDIKATEHSEGLTTNIETEHNEVATFKFDLFRKREYVQFEGLIEASNGDIRAETIENELTFKHRIENTSKIETKKLLSEKEIKKKKKKAILYSIVLFFLIVIISLTMILNVFGTREEKVYFTKNKASVEELYKVSIKNDLIELNPIIGDGEDFSISVNEFNNDYSASSKKLTFWQKFKEQYWILSFQLGFFLIIVLWELLEINQAKRLSKILTK